MVALGTLAPKNRLLGDSLVEDRVVFCTQLQRAVPKPECPAVASSLINLVRWQAHSLLLSKDPKEQRRAQELRPFEKVVNSENS